MTRAIWKDTSFVEYYAFNISFRLKTLSSDGCIFISRNYFIAKSRCSRAFDFSENRYLSLGLGVLFGLARTAKTTPEVVLLQTYSSAEYRGRAMSLLIMQMSLFHFGTFIVEVLSDIIGVQWATAGTAVVFLHISMWSRLKVPILRKLD